MITETTAISVIAFLALVTALGIAAGLGWMRCARLLKIARDEAAYWETKAAERLKSWNDACERGWKYGIALRNSQCLVADLRVAEKNWRSRWGRVMGLLRLAESANKELRTAQLQSIADRAEPVRKAA